MLMPMLHNAKVYVPQRQILYCKLAIYMLDTANAPTGNVNDGKTSYLMFTWIPDGARMGFKGMVSPWNVTGPSTALLPRRL